MKLATVGTSFISDIFIQALQEEPAFTLDTIYSRSHDKAKAFADKYSVHRIMTQWEELLNSDVDVVYVASPNDLHFSQSLELLRAGKHVICEKPFVSNHKEFVELMKVVEETQHFCFDAIMPMHLPNMNVIEDTLPLLGNVHLMSSTMAQYSSRYNLLLDGQIANIFDPQHAGGALMDLGVYPVTLAVRLFGKPNSVHYVAHQHDNGIDLFGVLTLQYPDTLVSCTIGKNSEASNMTIISGEKGCISIPSQPSQLREVNLTQGKIQSTIGVDQHPNGMVYEIQAFAKAIQTQDWNSYHEWMSITQEVLSILDKARSQIHLVFPKD